MRVEGRWENGEMKDWRENYGFGPSPVGTSEDGMLDEAARRPTSKPFSVLTIQEGDMTGENCSRRETVCGKSACA